MHKNPHYNLLLDLQDLVNSDPQLTAADYTNDQRLAANIEALKKSGIPYLVIHLPVLPEITEQKEYSDAEVEAIARAVTAKRDEPVYGLLDYMPLPLQKTEQMTISDTDLHPSRAGMILYTDAVINLMSKTGRLPPPRTAN